MGKLIDLTNQVFERWTVVNGQQKQSKIEIKQLQKLKVFKKLIKLEQCM